MMSDRHGFVGMALCCLLLGGCDKQAAEGNKAAGQVLDGTISDAMIATDQSRAEAPLAPRADKAAIVKGTKAKDKAAAAGDSDAAPSPDASRPSPEAAPSPKPSPSAPAG